MAEGRIEGESLTNKDVTAFLKDDEPTKNPSGLAVVSSQVDKADSARKAEETQQEVALTQVAKSRKTYEGTNIKARNPIIVVMIIMQVVSDTFKDAGDKTKEATKLLKKEWKHFSENQSKNFLAGKNNMEGSQCFQIAAFAVSQLHHAGKLFNQNMWNDDYDGGRLNIIVEGLRLLGKDRDAATETLKGLGTAGNSMLFQMGQQKTQIFGQEVQIKDALFQHEVAARNSDYQNKSQISSSDSQAKEGANEKGLQLARLAAQMLTGQPA